MKTVVVGIGSISYEIT